MGYNFGEVGYRANENQNLKMQDDFLFFVQTSYFAGLRALSGNIYSFFKLFRKNRKNKRKQQKQGQTKVVRKKKKVKIQDRLMYEQRNRKKIRKNTGKVNERKRKNYKYKRKGKTRK